MKTLKQWRDRYGVTQADIAKICKVHKNTVINWERQPHKIPVLQAFRISNYLRVPITEIDFRPRREVKE